MKGKNKGEDTLTQGQRAYEARRAARAGVTLERWIEQKEQRQNEEQKIRESYQRRIQEKNKKNGFFQKILKKLQELFRS